MRIIYFDIDSLRPDHLGCYGYHRNTSPNIDQLAAQAVIFENCYVTDAPCLPSRTALWRGQNGFHTGVVNHGGLQAQPIPEGASRGFIDRYLQNGWLAALRKAGIQKTAAISSFGERHSAWHWYAGYHEIFNSGLGGMDLAEDIADVALNWLRNNSEQDDWFLHVNFWDPHTPYRTPVHFGNPFVDDPLPAWLTEEVRQKAWDGFGPHSAQEPMGIGHEDFHVRYPRVPQNLNSMAAVRQWIDGYDVGVRYMDTYIGHIMDTLAELSIIDDTIIMISADHGENLGELNVWGDHQTADHWTCRVPLIVHWPAGGLTPRRDSALHYHYDWAATLIELIGGIVPDDWDGQSFANALQNNRESGRDYLVISQNAWACQRSVRFDNYLCMRTYHDGFKELEPLLLFDLVNDPHEQQNIAAQQAVTVNQAMHYLTEWQREMALTSQHNIDPMLTVLREGGPLHTRSDLETYVQRLQSTGREHHAQRLLAQHG